MFPSYVTEDRINQFIEAAILEDIGEGDHTTLATIPESATHRAQLLIKDFGVIAGVELAEYILKRFDPNSTFEVVKKDGTHVDYGDIAFYAEGNSRALLMAERLLLNTMQRMTGIASMTDRFVAEIEGTTTKLLDTRKTTPTIRFLEKWAVKIAGGTNYRFGLYDWIMIKDNHVDACGGIQKAIQKVQDYLKANQLERGITIEVRNLVELYQVLEIGQVSRIMLDNFELPILKEAITIIDGKFETEASGGVNIHTIGAIAETGVDFISVGALTHSYVSKDLSFKVVK
ncbi:MAG: carboxylating nicotinate-nucleotide diphosphorylase [Bacteroidota bacterium]